MCGCSTYRSDPIRISCHAFPPLRAQVSPALASYNLQDSREESDELSLLTGASIGVLAKIESADSVSHLEDILDAVDGAMVARGDLGAELPVEEVSFSCRADTSYISQDTDLTCSPRISGAQYELVEQVQETLRGIWMGVLAAPAGYTEVSCRNAMIDSISDMPALFLWVALPGTACTQAVTR